jgi:hypothetical protein
MQKFTAVILHLVQIMERPATLMSQAVNETKVLIQIVEHLFFVTAIFIGFELKAVSRKT